MQFPEYDFKHLPKCKQHPTYKAMRKPTADCVHCKELFHIRYVHERELVTSVIRNELDKKAVSFLPYEKGFYLKWDDMGRCIAQSVADPMCWATIPSEMGVFYNNVIIYN